MRQLNVLTWHVHGSYLNALVRVPHQWYLPVKPGRPEGYGGRGHTFDLPDNVTEIPAEAVPTLNLDVIIFQSEKNYRYDQYEVLSPAQQRLPRIYLEHNVPRPDAVHTRHPVDDPNVLLVHVTHYNQLMWDNGRTPTMVIEHAVAIDPTVRYIGDLDRGVTVANNMQRRPRIAGFDIFLAAREQVPLDAVGMGTEEFGGLGDIPYRELHHWLSHYRFLFSPMRYTSLPLAVVEAMTIGMPVVALATTALPSVIEDGCNGFISCDVPALLDRMRFLLDHPGKARRLGESARATAQERFSLERFVQDWQRALALVTQ